MQKTQTQVIILLGAPGSGKGSQAVLMKEKLRFPHISTGDILRENIKEKTDLGQKAQSYMCEGHLVPDELMFDMVYDRIGKPDCRKGYILDGFPRTLDQAISFQKRMGNDSEIVAINLSVPDSVIIERLVNRRICKNCQAPYNLLLAPPKTDNQCDHCESELIHRKDDSNDIIEKRLSVYHEQTAPLIDYFKKQDRLTTFDSNRSKEAILLQILRLVAKQN